MLNKKNIKLDFLEAKHFYHAIQILKQQSKEGFSKRILDLDRELITRKKTYLDLLIQSKNFPFLRENIIPEFKHTVYERVKNGGDLRKEDLFCINFYVYYYAIAIYLLELNGITRINTSDHPHTMIDSGIDLDCQEFQGVKSFTKKSPEYFYFLINDALKYHILQNKTVSFLRFDIKKFFGSINHQKLVYLLTQRLLLESNEYTARNTEIRDSLVSFLSSTTNRSSGIPHSSSNIAAFILSSLYLSPFDSYISNIRQDYSILSYYRWVDDIVFFISHPQGIGLEDINIRVNNFSSQISYFLNQKLGLEFHSKKRKHQLLRLSNSVKHNNSKTSFVF